jgi:hypothetical protein
VIVSAVWLFVPAVRSTSVAVDSSGTTVTESSSSTLLQSEGLSVAAVLAVPVVLAGIAVAAAGSRRARQVRYACGGLLAVGCLLGAASVGLPYLPAAVALLVAGATTRSLRTERSPPA